jgi:hypothetical protein
VDVEDLKAAIEHCQSIEELAEFLGRSDSVDDARANAKNSGAKRK